MPWCTGSSPRPAAEPASSTASSRFSRKDWLIYSYENCFLGTVCSTEFRRRRQDWLGPSERRTDLLVLRDPFNLFASRIRWSRTIRQRYPEHPLRNSLSTTRRIWKQHAREALRERQHLSRDRVLVRFNRWATDRAYRRDLAHRLGLDFTDAGIEHVPGVAGGSSFDGRGYDGRARDMPVLERWRLLADDPEYVDCFDQETVELSERLFGPIEGTQTLTP